MSLVTRITSGFRALFGRSRVNQELDDEVRHYLEESAAAHRAAGLSAEDAERAARVAIGSVASAQASARGWGWDVSLEALGQDVRYALRYLAKSPGFTLAVACSLALGIGANTAAFSMINATLIRKLPVERPEDLVSVASPTASGVFSYPAFDDVRRTATGFAGLTAFGGITVSLSEGENTDLHTGVIVTGNFFELLGVKPVRGRLLGPDDDRTPGAHPVAVISSSLWKQRFGSRSDIAGLPVRVNGQPFTIVGVLPAGFNGLQPGVARDVYVPMMMQAWMRPPRSGYSGEMNPDLLQVRTNTWLFAVGRLAPGASVEQVTTALNGTLRAMGDWTPRAADAQMPSARIMRLDDGPPGQREQLLSVARLLAAVVLAVLIISCANVANLLLARATARGKEIAVRLALGATRRRLVRQLLTESVLLSTLGGGLGLALAWVSMRALRASPPPVGALPVTVDFAIDARVLAFTVALSLLTGIVFGLMPALRASRPDLVPALKDQTSAPSRRRLLNPRNGLVVAQVSLSFVLLVAAGLFLRSLERMRSLSPGFDVDRLLTVPLNIQLLRYTREQGKGFYRTVVANVKALPGVEEASLVRWVPLSGGGSFGSLHIEGQTGAEDSFRSEGGGFDTSDPRTVSNDIVGTGYFATLGIALKSGRDFSDSDQDGAPPVSIVNETFVRRHFPGQDAIGKRISLTGPGGPWIQIVGVVADARYGALEEDPMRIVYLPSSQNHVNGMTLVVRARGNPAGVSAAVGREVSALDRSLPLAGTRTLEEWIGISIYAARAGATLVTGFGVLALLLAAVGLYGVLAYAVARRTREFGLRMALGAKARNLLGQVLGEGMSLVAIGVAGGLVAAISVTHLLAKFVPGVSTTDTRTFLSTPALLFAVAAGACLIPALRATRVDPIRSLRQD